MWMKYCVRGVGLLYAASSSATSLPEHLFRGPSIGGIFLPRGLSVGTELVVNTGEVTTFTLGIDSPLVTLDYRVERACYLSLSVADVTKPVQIEVKYCGFFVSLAHPWTDNPYSFTTGLPNSFRVETFNVTSQGRFSAP
ncbi:putative Alpha-L-rhamnosidase six-hairpin glycosidase domain-containing protein [Seiridium cardinale]|uniref:Alpha-L-rhamnosidase six-hairpin glycosidase domain-containing protein n=1 Tax=Seiridium cardinale TaxID=138064 RepID=A0ABR2X7C1_9PEZI